MANTLKIKRSGTWDSNTNPSSLAYGEVAWSNNVAKLFVGRQIDNSGTVQPFHVSTLSDLTAGTGLAGSLGSGNGDNDLTLSLDLNELGNETSIAQPDFIAMVDATDNGSQKITFSNLEDTIFGNVSGDATIAAGGTLTIANDAVEQAMIADDAVGADQLASNAVVNASISSSAAIDMDKLDGDSLASSLSDFAQDDLVILSDTSDSGNLKSMTTSNLEDSIFGNVSGDIAIAAGGAATIQANSVALTTDTTGNYVGTVTGGTGISSTGATSGEGIAHTLSVSAAQTSITSIYNTGLKLGYGSSHAHIDFSTDNEIHMEIDGSPEFKVLANGISINEGDKIFLDGGGDTYIQDDSGDTMRFVVGNRNMFEMIENSSDPDEIVVNQSGGNVDFRIESESSANAFKVDASNGNVSVAGDLSANSMSITTLGVTTLNATNVDTTKIRNSSDADMMTLGGSYTTFNKYAVMDTGVAKLVLKCADAATTKIEKVNSSGELTIYNGGAGNAENEEHIVIHNGVQDKDIIFKVNDGGTSAAAMTITGATKKVTIAGDLHVSGTTTTVNSSTLDVADINITVAKNATTSSATDGAGLTFGAWSSGTIPTLTYVHSGTKFSMNKPLSVTGTITSSSTITGTALDGCQVDGGVF